MGADFREAIERAGLTPPDRIEPSKFYRFPGTGKGKQNTAGWCMQFPDGAGGVYGDFASGLSETWQATRDRPMTAGEHEAFNRQAEEARRKAEAERLAKQAEAASSAREILEAAEEATDEHPYLKRKGIDANGLKLYRGDLEIAGMPCDGALIAMIGDAKGAVISLQFIGADGEKRFFPGGSVRGGYHGFAKSKPPFKVLAIAEGIATAASIHEATGHPVVAAFNADNLPGVALALHEKYPGSQLILCADDDYRTQGNPGITKATEAALAVGGLLAVPDFGATRPEGATDFNDLAKASGPEAINAAISAARVPTAHAATVNTAPNATRGAAGENEWPEPQPLIAKVNAEPYPLDALPSAVRKAVEEVQGFTQAPVAMVASSALAALSIAIQSGADVRRADKLSGPTSLFLLTIADSGERKSTNDGFFTTAIKDYDRQQAELAKPDIARYQASREAWDAEREGIKAKIRDEAKKGHPTVPYKDALRELERTKPQPPRVPQLLRGDDTPENLAFVLAREWPSAGVASSEAGSILGAHGMGKDSVMRNLALLNILWENGTLSIGRRTSESFTLRGARLTVALQVQEPTLRAFFDRSQGLARGTGFLARFLIAWPESTQGQRQFKEAPAHWPALAEFNTRLAAILVRPVPIGEDGALTPAVLTLTPEAKAAWVSFHNVIEAELCTGGELYDVRDVASKTADNAARLAALFQIFEHGMGGAIGLECFEGASRIAAWHLHEARRFFGELALPAELANASRLDTWLIDYCRRGRTHTVPRREVQRCGPYGLRTKAALSEALRELVEAGRVREVTEGRNKSILVNPALLGLGAA